MLSNDLLDAIKAIKGNGVLLSDKDLDDTDIDVLIDTLNNLSNIHNLDLSFNNITRTGAIKLLTKLQHIQVLNLKSNDISFTDKPLNLNNCKLKELDISANCIGDSIVAFSTVTSLEKLKASECNVTDMGAQELFKSKSIKELDLTTNEINGASLEELSINHTLQILYLAQNSLLADSLNYLLENDTLTVLDLTSTLIGDKGAEILSKNTRLKELFLSQCFIGDDGAKFLSMHTTLEKLILSHNNITEVGKKALNESTSLVHINLSDNHCSKNLTFIDSIISKRKTETITKSFDYHKSSISSSGVPSSDDDTLSFKKTSRLRDKNN